MPELLTTALLGVAAYLLGSVNGSLVLGRLSGVDIRKLGSGNAGGTNALRTQGKWFALGVVLIDVAKGWLAVVAAKWMSANHSTSEWLPAMCGFAAMVGHVWPLWHGFRGGKGAATLVGALLALDAPLLVPVIAIWLLFVVGFGYVGFATVAAALALPVYVLAARDGNLASLLLFTCAAALLIIATHRRNLARMRAGTEPRSRRLWLLGKGTSK
ncbi:MAG TPA: glycerol-3-phosphate 1-O-acyltransferase PlsY [Steroidobacteraceae bacterium]|nr:glycerol-3-phosphate 1-O-acyltransferase PlsY [Steroidobacteraceae bacterium]HRX90067.1 glycerol-3-phosphate 1-O-acyltransferase PlsY [Steroidobacteraceae bacterium]